MVNDTMEFINTADVMDTKGVKEIGKVKDTAELNI